MGDHPGCSLCSAYRRGFLGVGHGILEDPTLVGTRLQSRGGSANVPSLIDALEGAPNTFQKLLSVRRYIPRRAVHSAKREDRYCRALLMRNKFAIDELIERSRK